VAAVLDGRPETWLRNDIVNELFEPDLKFISGTEESRTTSTKSSYRNSASNSSSTTRDFKPTLEMQIRSSSYLAGNS